jgi:hypothetical protein
MTTNINHLYIESYVTEFTQKVCDQHFQQQKYITGPQIVQLTSTEQVNFFVIKAIFEAWQEEIEKLKSSPYFDYRDKAVHDALKEFMNVLSRTIKIDRFNFEPLLLTAVFDVFQLAIDPLSFFSQEIEKCPENQLNTYFKDNKRYYKWHRSLIENLIDRAALGFSHKAYKAALKNNFEQQAAQLMQADELLKSLSDIHPIDLSKVFETPKRLVQEVVQPKEENFVADTVKRTALFTPIVEEKVSNRPITEETTASVMRGGAESGRLDAHKIWERLESEEYSIMKGTIKELTESIGINQRFMFTKELFDGNPDLLRHALRSIDKCETFTDAINILNLRYVDELKWNLESDSLEEFLQLVFRKFDKRG